MNDIHNEGATDKLAWVAPQIDIHSADDAESGPALAPDAGSTDSWTARRIS